MRRPEPLPPNLRELLSAERDIEPVPDSVRRRAELRARTAHWHVRHSPGGSPFAHRFGLLRLAVAGVTVASASLGAWLVVRTPAAVTPAEQVFTPSIAGKAARPQVAQLAVETSTQSEVPHAGSPQPQPPTTVEASELDPIGDPPRTEPNRRLEGKTAAPSPRAQSAATTMSVKRPKPLPGISPADVELLDRARKALGEQDHERALQLLETHRRRFPGSELTEERDALRVRALAGAGRSSDARKAASGFQKHHPRSVLAPTLKRSSSGDQ